MIFFLQQRLPGTGAEKHVERSKGSDCICRRSCIMSGCGIEAGEGGKWSPERGGAQTAENCGRRAFEQVN